jgi:hypothetical protein
MARAVQCPACGQTHPVDKLAGTPTFSCEGCGRTLRTPTELVRPSGSTPAVRAAPKPAASAPQPAPASARPARVRTATAPAGRQPKTAEKPPRSRGPLTTSGAVTVPLRIGAWIVAVAFGLILTWIVASVFGFISRSQVVDMFRSSSPGNYIRLYLLVPVWAFMSACLATGLIEGARLYLARRAAAPPGSTPASPPGSNPRSSPRPSVGTPPEADERPSQPVPPREPLPPGQRRRIRPREPTV